MGRCDCFEKGCFNMDKCAECLNPKKPDIREKIKEYIMELKQEIEMCISWIVEHMDGDACQVSVMEMRVKTLGEVVNDLESRLEELV